MKNIAIIIYDASVMGGAENVGLTLANELSAFYNITVISLFSQNKKTFFKMYDTVDYVVISEKTVQIPFHVKMLAGNIHTVLIKKQINVVLCITAGIITPVIGAVKNTKAKLIYCEHSNLKNDSYGVKHRIRQWLGAKYANWIVTLTDEDKEAFQNKYKVRNVSRIYNWYNHKICSTNYNVESKKIITVGRFVKLKGYEQLLDIAKVALSDCPNWQWDIYGDGEEFDTIKSKIKLMGLEKKVILKGKCSDIIQIYKDYAIYVLTSKFEGLPMVLLEAQANGLPIVSYKCPTGPSEIVEDQVNGYLIEPNDVNKMSEKIKELIMSDVTRICMSNNSMKNFEKFTKKTVLPQWVNLIETVLGGND